MSATETTFERAAAGARKEGLKKVVVRRRNQADVVFEGVLVARVAASVEPSDEGSCSEPWTELQLYSLPSEKYACVKIDAADLRRVRREVELCDDLKAVVGACGLCDLAKELYAVAGIDACERLEGGPEDEEEAAAEADKAQTEAATQEGLTQPKVNIFDPEAVASRIRRLEKERDARVLPVLRNLRDSGSERRLVQVPEDAPEKLVALEKRFPNFIQVLAYLREQVSLAARAQYRVLRLAPLLMEGPPGVGKTRLVLELARVLGAECVVIALNTLSASFILSGSDSRWGTAKVGRILELLRDGKSANPLVLLDELDKTRAGTATNGTYDPYGPLYGLLERRTAAAFEDEFAEVALDASQICWIATANDPAAVPAAILSRFRRVPVSAPRPEQMAAIVASVWRDLVSEEPWGLRFASELSPATVARLSTMAPRDLRQALSEAAGRCSAERETGYQGQFVIMPRHIDAPPGSGSGRDRIGFRPRRG